MHLTSPESLINCIQKNFHPLLAENFRLIFEDWPNAFDNFVMIFETKDLRVRFYRDRSYMDLEIGTLEAELGWSGNGWASLNVIVFYLTKGQLLLGPLSLEPWFDTEKQIESLAHVFFFFLEKIKPIFDIHNFSEIEPELCSFSEKMTRILFYKPSASVRPPFT